MYISKVWLSCLCKYVLYVSMSVCVCIALNMSLCLCSFVCACVCICLCLCVVCVCPHARVCVYAFVHLSLCVCPCTCVMMRLWGRQCFLCLLGYHFSAYRDPLSLPHPCLYLITSLPSTRGRECGSSPSSLSLSFFFFKNINMRKKLQIGDERDCIKGIFFFFLKKKISNPLTVK